MAELGPVLELAVEAAVVAGALIRQDFHRPDGPRGAGDHADVDTEADLLIRARLRGAHPEWSYFGEETGWDGPVRPDVYWLVDPNDGTSSYLRGRRGSAVSIALIRGELPVLGVVYAPTAPDDDGDLIAWAEGLPLTRNRRPLMPALPDRASAGGVALVSLGARRSTLGYSRALDPLRFRSMPSIAYRLALNAVGDGDATVSFSGPGDYDVAGGHAVLRGAGGDLLRADGSPARYGAATRHSPRCFGGSPALAGSLAALDWSPVRTPDADDPLEAAYPFAQPAPGRTVADAGRLSRAQGCLFGQFAGDALGSLVEFEPAAAIRRAYPGGVRDLADGGYWGTIAGQPTDDSELALMLARTLVRDGRYDAAAALAAYRAWHASDPFDIGTTTRLGLAGRPDHGSQANGSLVRISPLGVFGHALAADRLAALARADSRLTHPNPVCADACAVFAVAVAHAIRTGDAPPEVYAAAVAWAEHARLDAGVLKALAAAAHALPEGIDGQHKGWVLIALQNACYRLLHAGSLEQGVIDTVMTGGDTDTTAAIAGALLGAVHGREAVPARWRRAVLACRPVAGAPGVRRPRPKPCWPVDTLELAEALLLAGG